MSSLQTEVDYSSFKDVDIVIEAVFEDINLKHRIIKEVSHLSLLELKYYYYFESCLIISRFANR